MPERYSRYERKIVRFLQQKGGCIRAGNDNIVAYLARKLDITVNGVLQVVLLGEILHSMQVRGMIALTKDKSVKARITEVRLVVRRPKRRRRKQ